MKKRGDKPGLVWIFSALEPCTTYRPWRDHATQRTYLRYDDGKCLHYYFYFIDEELGLCYVRVPTWCPFRLQFYCNAHNWLAGRLRRHRIAFRMCDNAFVEIADWTKAQRLADGCKPERLHRRLTEFSQHEQARSYRGLISSIPKMSCCLRSSRAGSSTSAAFATRRRAGGCRASVAGRFRGC